MTLRDLTLKQLERLHRRVYDSLGDGGWYGWDWPTIRAIHPGKAAALRALVDEIKRRRRSGSYAVR